MLFGNTGRVREYADLEEDIKTCFQYAKEHDLSLYEKGTHEIEGKRLFVNIVEYTTTTAAERFWEAHREYLDIHLMLRGSEQIDLNLTGSMIQKTYEPEADFLPMEGEADRYVVLHEGDFLICGTCDAHRTAILVEKPDTVKKAIFKVRIQQ